MNTSFNKAMSKITYCSPKHNFAYLAVPKTASSSIVAWLLRLEGLKWDDKVAENNRYRTIQKYLKLSQHPQIKNPFRFTFIRDPKTRIASAFLDKFVKTLHHPAKGVKNELGKPEGITFREFVHWLSTTDLKDVDIHWMPQILMVHHFEPDFLGTMENIDEGLREVSESIGIPISIGHDRRVLADCHQHIKGAMDIVSSQMKDLNPMVESFYDSELTAMVEELYHEDIELWRAINAG